MLSSSVFSVLLFIISSSVITADKDSSSIEREVERFVTNLFGGSEEEKEADG